MREIRDRRTLRIFYAPVTMRVTFRSNEIVIQLGSDRLRGFEFLTSDMGPWGGESSAMLRTLDQVARSC